MKVNCMQCGLEQTVSKSRAESYKFCSYACRGEWRKENFSGDKNPNWKGGVGVKKCQYCNKEFSHPIKTIFEKRKFCSKSCADKGGVRYSGDSHPNYKGGKSKRTFGHRVWAQKVISRDNSTCQKCGVTETELHAHHIKSWKDNPESRFDVDNGVTLCAPCHWKEHSALNDNEVNSVEPLTDGAEGNTEPSFDGNIIEGVTTRGRAYRRWNGHCEWCGEFISKRISDVKAHNFCGRSCASKYRVKHMGALSKAVTSSKSASHESEDIV